MARTNIICHILMSIDGRIAGDFFRLPETGKAAARFVFLMAYYLFTTLTPPASFELAEFYIDRALEWDETPECREWKNLIDKGNEQFPSHKTKEGVPIYNL